MCDHKSSCSVVHCSTYIVAIIEDHKLIFVGDDVSYFNAELFDFFFGGTAAVQENIVFGRRLFVFSFSGMNCWSSKNGFDSFTVCGSNIYSFARRDLVVRSTVSDDIDEAIVSHIIYEPADFVTVCLEDNFVGAFGIDNPDGSAVAVCEDFVYIWSDIVHPDFLAGVFKSSR